MTIEEMKKLKKEWGYTNEQVSEASGVPLGTIQKVFSGATKSPRYATMLALERFFSDESHAVYPGHGFAGPGRKDESHAGHHDSV